MERHAWLVTDDDEYDLLGIEKGSPKPWEDGLRTNGAKGTYEWWYFDSKLNDGSSLVVVFFTKPIASLDNNYVPYATFTLTKPDGSRIYSETYQPIDSCSYSHNKCDVKIGACSFKGDMHTYDIHWDYDGIIADIELRGNVPSWRPESGHILFDFDNYFAWLPSVPEGDVEVTVTMGDSVESYSGTGYHDHNWGNTPMFFMMHHWYWGRAKVGDYQVITSYITANKKHSYDETPIFMLARNGEIIADCPEKYLTYSELEPYYDVVTRKHVAGKLIYDYDDGNQHYRITYTREGDIERMGMETQVTKLQYAAILLMGLRGSYHRMVGTVTLERIEGSEIVEKVTSHALWELMYFGKDRITKKSGRI